MALLDIPCGGLHIKLRKEALNNTQLRLLFSTCVANIWKITCLKCGSFIVFTVLFSSTWRKRISTDRPIFLFNDMKYREKWNYCFHKSWLMIPKLFLKSRSSEVHDQKTAMLSSQMHGIIWHLAFYKFHELLFKRMQTGNFSILKLLNFQIFSALKMYFVLLLISSFSILPQWFVLLSVKRNRIQARLLLFNNYLNSTLISSCSSIFKWC